MTDDGVRGGLRPGPSTMRSLAVPRWAVLVGVSEYEAPSLHLRYAHRDVEELWKVLQTNACGQFVPERAKILVNEKAWRKYLAAGAPLGHREKVEAFLAHPPVR